MSDRFKDNYEDIPQTGEVFGDNKNKEILSEQTADNTNNNKNIELEKIQQAESVNTYKTAPSENNFKFEPQSELFQKNADSNKDIPYDQPTTYNNQLNNGNGFREYGQDFGRNNYNYFQNSSGFRSDFAQNGHIPAFGSKNQNDKPPQKNSGLKIALICVSSVLAVVSAAFIVSIVRSNISGGNIGFYSENSGYLQEPSYGTISQLPDAPIASPDENGPQISTQETSDSQTAGSANSAYKKMSPSVVCITSYEAGKDYILTESGEGSGIVISKDGYIATNSHVVNDSKDTGVMITLNTGEQYLGTIIGIDPKTDLAVIKIDADSLIPADFADSEKLVVGQVVYAIGNPGGSAFSNSLTTGSISALNRILSSNSYVKYIQTDAAINPGNSGGALVNEYGQVIGINTAKLVGTDYEGMGFSIPSNTVKEIINKLIKYGYVNDRGTLGIEGKTCSLYNSKLNNVPQGMIITKIEVRSPLYSTQAKKDDIITAVDGIQIKSSTEFIDQISQYNPGDKVTLTIFRTKKNTNNKPYTYTLEVTLIEDISE